MEPAHVERALTADEKAAVRAYLQRTEVRLSTLHRVASALLSGAGLMVLLPAVERDTVIEVVGALLHDGLDFRRGALLVAMSLMVALPFATLCIVVRDLTTFYFHANHIRHDGGEAFTPRFTLTGLRLPSDELGPDAHAHLDALRAEDRNVALLVPDNDASREVIDERVAAYGGLGQTGELTDASRAAALFELAASRQRPLLDEVAKVEHGLARHVLRLQVIVLRYVKALLALLITALAAFAAAAVVGDHDELGPRQQLWLACIVLVWAPTVVLAVASPVRWLERHLRSEGATRTGVADDRDLTRLELMAIRLAAVAAGAATATMISLATVDGLSRSTHWGGVAVAIAAWVVTGVAAWQTIRHRRTARRRLRLRRRGAAVA